MSDSEVKEETPREPFNWLKVIGPVSIALVILLLLITPVNPNIVMGVAVTIVVVVLLGAAKLNGWFENFDFERFKFSTVLVGLATLGGFLIWFMNKIIEFMTFDPTPLSPAIFLLVCLIIGIMIPYWTIPRDEDDSGLLFGENRVYYLGWVNFMVMIYSLSSYHFRLWWPTAISVVVVSLVVSKIHKNIKLYDNGSKKKHGLIEVLMSPTKKIYIWLVMLLFVDVLIVPAALVGSTLGSWWHLFVVLSPYLFGFWLCYLYWYERNFVKYDLTSLPNTTVAAVRERHLVRERLIYNSFLNRALRAFGFNKP
jgi:hypothetical protein